MAPPAAPVEPCQARPQRDWSRPFFWVVLLCLVTGIAHFLEPAPTSKPGRSDEGDTDFWSTLANRMGPGIAVVKVYGAISMPDKESYYGGEGAQDIADILHKLRKRDDCKGIVLRVNSPGGSVGASQEIYDEVKGLVAMGKKVVVSMGDVAASGGYYISAPADYIFVNPGTITGSIGVISGSYVFKELMDKIGVHFNTFKSGEFKDMGSPSRPLTDRERAVFESIIMGAYGQFVKAVAGGRVLTAEKNGRKVVLKSEDEVRKLADGRIYTGAQAIQNGLADAEGSFYDAVSKCGEMAGLGKDPAILKSRGLPPLPEFLRMAGSESSAESLARAAERLLSQSSAPVLYLYRP